MYVQLILSLAGLVISPNAGIYHQRAAKAEVHTFVNAATIRHSVHQGRIVVRKIEPALAPDTSLVS